MPSREGATLLFLISASSSNPHVGRDSSLADDAADRNAPVQNFPIDQQPLDSDPAPIRESF
jgi:hypothetical protein